MSRVETGTGWSMHLGRWQAALAHVTECDALITDAPYSPRTHAAYSPRNPATHGTSHERTTSERVAAGLLDGRRPIDYAAWTEDDVNVLVDHWGPRCSGWICSLTSHDLVQYWAGALAMPESGGRYVFAPLPCVIRGMTVRLVGDGPSSESVSLVVARPRTSVMAKWGTLPGHYYGPSERCIVVGGKPLWLMRAIIRDYTRPGDLVVDPCAGGGTTLLAAVMEGRRAIGAECDSNTFEKAVARLRKGYSAPLPFTEQPRMEQIALLGES